MEDEVLIEGSKGGPYMVDKIVGIYMGKNLQKYYRVKWSDSWEPEELLSESCKQLINEFWSGTTLDKNGREVKQTELKLGQKIVKKEMIPPANNDTSVTSPQQTTMVPPQPSLLPVELKKDIKQKPIIPNMIPLSNPAHIPVSNPTLVSLQNNNIQTVVHSTISKTNVVQTVASTTSVAASITKQDALSHVVVNNRTVLQPNTQVIPVTTIEAKSELLTASLIHTKAASLIQPQNNLPQAQRNQIQSTTLQLQPSTILQHSSKTPTVINRLQEQQNGSSTLNNNLTNKQKLQNIQRSNSPLIHTNTSQSPLVHTNSPQRRHNNNILSTEQVSTLQYHAPPSNNSGIEPGQIFHRDHNNVMYSSPPQSVNLNDSDNEEVLNERFPVDEMNVFQEYNNTEEEEVEILSENTDSQSDVIDVDSDDELEITASIESPQRKRKKRSHNGRTGDLNLNLIPAVVTKQPRRGRGRPPNSQRANAIINHSPSSNSPSSNARRNIMASNTSTTNQRNVDNINVSNPAYATGPLHPRRLLNNSSVVPTNTSTLSMPRGNVSANQNVHAVSSRGRGKSIQSSPRSLGRSHVSKAIQLTQHDQGSNTFASPQQQQTASVSSTTYRSPINQQQNIRNQINNQSIHTSPSTTNQQYSNPVNAQNNYTQNHHVNPHNNHENIAQVSPRHPRNQNQVIRNIVMQNEVTPPRLVRHEVTPPRLVRQGVNTSDSTIEKSPSLNGILNDRTCTLCSHTFANLTLARQHVKSIHTTPTQQNTPSKSVKKSAQTTTSAQSTAPWASTMFTCTTCNVAFHMKEEYKSHMNDHHGSPLIQVTKCQICFRIFKTVRDLSTHMLIHNEELPFSCDICHKRFRQQAHLINHKGSKHRDNNQGTYTCPHCTISFKDNVEFKRHMHQHDTQLPFVCNICNERFDSKPTLLLHLDDHNNGRPFTCHICKKSFKTKTYLYGHMQMHKVALSETTTSNIGKKLTPPKGTNPASNLPAPTSNMSNHSPLKSTTSPLKSTTSLLKSTTSPVKSTAIEQDENLASSSAQTIIKVQQD